MEQIASVFISSDRIYLTCAAASDKGLQLTYIDSTNNFFDIENPGSENSNDALKEFSGMLKKFDRKAITKINIIVPPESIVVTQIPAKEGISRNELNKLAALELSQVYPDISSDNLKASIIPFSYIQGKKEMMLTVALPPYFNEVKKMFSDLLPVRINRVEISPLSAVSSFMYNYPERKMQNIVLFGIHDKYADIILIKRGMTAYYNQLIFPFGEKAGETINVELQNLMTNYIKNIDSVFFYGCGITKEIYLSAWENTMLLEIEAVRFNTFRMVRTELPKRVKDYCSRTSHIYASAIGGALPMYYKKFDLN